MGQVANISLQGKGLRGQLSPAISGLKNLTGIYLHYNSLFGPIPREISSLSYLVDLYLDVNNFSGSIPPEIGNMESLQGLFFVISFPFFSVSFLSDFMDFCQRGFRLAILKHGFLTALSFYRFVLFCRFELFSFLCLGRGSLSVLKISKWFFSLSV